MVPHMYCVHSYSLSVAPSLTLFLGVLQILEHAALCILYLALSLTMLPVCFRCLRFFSFLKIEIKSMYTFSIAFAPKMLDFLPELRKCICLIIIEIPVFRRSDLFIYFF